MFISAFMLILWGYCFIMPFFQNIWTDKATLNQAYGTGVLWTCGMLVMIWIFYQSWRNNENPKNEENKSFRKKVRKHNQLVNFGIDPEISSYNTQGCAN